MYSVNTAIDIIKKEIASQKERLKTGIERREDLAEVMAMGVTPDCPRVRYIRQCILDMSSVLVRNAEVFNRENPDDRVSQMDMEDAVKSLLATLHKG